MGISFEVTALKGVNRVGNLKRLDKGYLQVILGALEFENSAGAVYDQQRVEKMLAENGMLQRRINAGFMRGEWGHPKEYDYPNYRQFLQRIHTIDERNWAIHIRKVWVEPNFRLPNGKMICAIMGEVAPTGNNNAGMERILSNPDENLAFSIRSLATDRLVGGKIRKYIDNIITWDVVNEPGLSVANKFEAPSCESALVVPVQGEILRSLLVSSTGVACESSMRDTLTAYDAYVRSQHNLGRKGSVTRW